MAKNSCITAACSWKRFNSTTCCGDIAVKWDYEIDYITSVFSSDLALQYKLVE